VLALCTPFYHNIMWMLSINDVAGYCSFIGY